jgi:glutathione S-transferase
MDDGAAAAPAPAPARPPLTIYWGSGSPPAWRVLAALAEKGIAFRSEMVTFESGVLKTPAMLSLNPRGLVPILIDGDVRIFESLAILHYLEREYPARALMPAERVAHARALMRMEEANNASVAAGEIVYYMRRTRPEHVNDEYLSAKRAALDAELSLWESYLVSSYYLAGPGQDATLADFAFFPNLAYMVRLGLALEGRYPNLFAYFQRMAMRPSILASWPPHWLTTKAIPILA